ncbi:hypothetical protein [Aromatoleum evansii]|uniref:hypothetical protein n=1 Tax=Aromatoleum evansii TaxID=59406 RepID=UPI00145CA71D|nr:hypothetical protein [Aromatoleum evansii]NMG29339.1 hypothetical protein [Aromatoleum evansii]
MRQINHDLGRDPSVRAACIAIVDYLAGQPVQNLQHITFGALGRMAGTTSLAEIMPAIRYLTGAALPLLDPQFEFIDGEFIEPLSTTEVAEARGSGIFYHPESGEQVADFATKIFMHFSLSEEGKGLTTCR